MRTALVCGAGGFIGSHLVRRLRTEGFWVRGADLKPPEFAPSAADEFVLADLRDPVACQEIVDRRFDEVYQLAADMGGAGFIFTGDNDAAVMHNSASINLNMVETCRPAELVRWRGCRGKQAIERPRKYKKDGVLLRQAGGAGANAGSRRQSRCD